MSKFNLLKRLQLKSVKTTTIFIFIISLFFLFNLLLSPFSLRMDFSKSKAYSLSSSTKKILNKLEKPILIKFFVSSDIPTKLIPLKNDVIDLLNEYEKQNNKVDLKIVDPKNNSKTLDEAKSVGIPELQFSQLEKDKYALSKVYFGILISYQDKKEVLSQVSDTASLEYNLTAAIYKLSNKDIAKVEIIGQSETSNPSVDDQLTSLTKVLRQQFEVVFTDKISDSAKTVLIFDDNKKTYSYEEISSIKKYLNSGGKIIFFVDGVWVEDNFTTQPTKNNFEKVFKDYGITLNNNLILSANAETVNFGNGLVSFFVPYPFWLKTNNFNNKISYFSNISQLTFPWASSINISKKDNIEVNPLVYSADRSWEQKSSSASSGFILDPRAIPQPQIKELNKKLLAVDVKVKNKGEFFLIPSSRFVLERYFSKSSGNLELVFNIVNDFASSGALSGIRQRQISFYPLPDLNDQMKDLFKYLNIFLLPLVFVIYGAVRLIKRK